MIDAEALVRTAVELLQDLPPRPWTVHEWSVSDANRYEVIADMAGVSDEVRAFLADAPEIIQAFIEVVSAMIDAHDGGKGWE